MLAKIKAALAWFRGLFTKGKTDMTDVVAATEATVETALSTVETDVKAVVVADPGSAGLAAAGLVAPDGATVVQKTAPTPVMTAAAIVDVEASAAKLRDVFDKLGIVLPAQWAQVVALAKVL
ncbi:hypothetical protein [Rhizobium rhizogenes]|uniref:hypothetical protein n=1 Tax=Rhizobium rhizogenes TaxID=359 RepID=UPI001572BDB4|nr:hypothetical protein [Rhizobium rhizogenes]NTF67961.1 hypothetical protein [Rhizobium rhizogenes]